jgi:hypothetical protein
METFCVALNLKDWKVVKVHKYSHSKRGTFKIIYLPDVFPVKVVSEDTISWDVMPHWLVDVNDKPDDGDTALL